MSGGLYGRGKAPQRACMPVRDWPAADRALWEGACKPGGLLDDDLGSRSDHAAITNRKVERGYGRWLTFLTGHAPQSLQAAPGERITKDMVGLYVIHLQDLGNSTATLVSRLAELGAAAQVMAPDGKFGFLNRMAGRIRARHRPARDKTCRALSNDLLEVGLGLMARAGPPGSLQGAIEHRDGLVVALLSLAPLRRRNLAELTLGGSLVEVGEGYLISFGPGETKTGAPLELRLPAILAAHLREHLLTWRPILAARTGRWSGEIGEAVWVSKDGSRMTQTALYDRVCLRTGQALGAPVNPHAFRHAAATTQAIADPAHARIAAPLLGHRTFTTTETYYQQATGLEARRAFTDMIEGLRSESYE